MSGLTTPADVVDTQVPSEDTVQHQYTYHSISAAIHHDGFIRVVHNRLDPGTRRNISEQLTSPPPVESGPWSWEETLLLAAMELLDRRVAEENAVPF